MKKELIEKIKYEIECLKAFFLGFGHLDKIKDIFQLEKDFERLLTKEEIIEENNVIIFKK